MAMNTHTLVNLCILCSVSYLLILTATVSSQRYSFRHKSYFLIQEKNTFDEAVALCKSRGESLVEIKNRVENEFVRTISQSAGFGIWLGATNKFGTKQFKWLSDGSDVNSQYTNWRASYPDKDANNRNAIAILNINGEWYDFSVCEKIYVLCEQDNVLDLQSKLTEHTDQSNAKFEQLDSQLKVTASTQRKEYLQLILEVKQDYDRVHDQLANQMDVTVQQQKDIIKKLENQANEMATELEFQKQVITRLNTNDERLDERNKNLKSRLNSNEITCDENIISLKKDNDLLERRLNRLEEKMTTNILDNSNKLE